MYWIVTIAVALVIFKLGKDYLEKIKIKKGFIKDSDTIDERYNAEKKMKQLEVDRLLEKVAKNGIESLSVKEKEILDEYSRRV